MFCRSPCQNPSLGRSGNPASTVRTGVAELIGGQDHVLVLHRLLPPPSAGGAVRDVLVGYVCSNAHARGPRTRRDEPGFGADTAVWGSVVRRTRGDEPVAACARGI